MKQYLLSIYQPDGEAPPPAAVLEKVMRDMHALIQEAKAAGAWVFNGGLHPPSTATVVRTQRGEVLIDRRPVRGKQGTHRRIHGHQGAGPRRGAEWARQDGARAHARGPRRTPDRGPAVPGGGPYLIASVPPLDSSEIERVFREEHGRAVAVLVRQFGDIDVAEEAVQDAFTVAVQRWPAAGLPPSPAGWIITTARNRAIDRLRREASREERHAQAVLLQADRESVRAKTRRVPCATIDCA